MSNGAGKRKFTFGMFILWTAIIALLIGESLLSTWSRVQCTQTGYEISQETRQYEALAALQKNLKIELAYLKSPERISAIASQQLGLVMPDPGQMVVVP